MPFHHSQLSYPSRGSRTVFLKQPISKASKNSQIIKKQEPFLKEHMKWLAFRLPLLRWNEVFSRNSLGSVSTTNDSARTEGTSSRPATSYLFPRGLWPLSVEDDSKGTKQKSIWRVLYLGHQTGLGEHLLLSLGLDGVDIAVMKSCVSKFPNWLECSCCWIWTEGSSADD